MNILLGITGSVATIRTPGLVRVLSKVGNIQIVSTRAALHFLERAGEPIPEGIRLFRDADEWSSWKELGDPVLHIELRKWAEILLVAPASANFIAKVSSGISDNLLLSVCRAWDFSKPMVLAPAMNTMMWEHPVTQSQLSVLRNWGTTIVSPVVKELACGDIGTGGLADAASLLRVVERIKGP